MSSNVEEDAVSPALSDSGVHVKKGAISVYLYFEVGERIDLHTVLSLLGRMKTEQRGGFTPPGRLRETFGYSNPPIRFKETRIRLDFDDVQTNQECEVTLWPNGVISVQYDIDLIGGTDLAKLHLYHRELANNEKIERDAVDLVKVVFERVKPAIEDPELGTRIEDYIEFCIQETVERISATDLRDKHRVTLTSVLRPNDASNDVGGDVIDASLRYSHSRNARELLVIDENAAFIFGPVSQNVHELLEFGQMWLLELNHFDDIQDRRLNRGRALSDEMGPRIRRSWWNRAPLIRWLTGTIRWCGAFILQRSRFQHSIHEAMTELQALDRESLGLNFQFADAVALQGDATLYDLYIMVTQRFAFDEIVQRLKDKQNTLHRTYENLASTVHNQVALTVEIAVCLLVLIEVIISLYEHFFKAAVH